MAPAAAIAAQRGGRRGGEVVAVLVGGVGASVGAVVWVSGRLAGRLWRGEWVAVPATAVALIVVRLPAHAADPRLAWPAAARPDLPGAAALYSVGAVVAVVAVALVGGVAVAARSCVRRWFGGGFPRPGSLGRTGRQASGWPRRLEPARRPPGRAVSRGTMGDPA